MLGNADRAAPRKRAACLTLGSLRASRCWSNAPANSSSSSTWALTEKTKPATLAACLPMLSKMLIALEAVKQAAEPLRVFLEFKKYSSAAPNSFVHAGAYALHRLRTGFPLELVEVVVKQSNALVVMAHMQLAITAGSQEAVRWVAKTLDGFPAVLPPRIR
ncbi:MULTISPECIES: DUF6988 family protein [Xanthomonas]|uniref:DUF6988 family protein n=1 Tax=Xanthomonas TaxID=338 RepID=UPI003CCFB526